MNGFCPKSENLFLSFFGRALPLNFSYFEKGVQFGYRPGYYGGKGDPFSPFINYPYYGMINSLLRCDLQLLTTAVLGLIITQHGCRGSLMDLSQSLESLINTIMFTSIGIFFSESIHGPTILTRNPNIFFSAVLNEPLSG